MGVAPSAFPMARPPLMPAPRGIIWTIWIKVMANMKKYLLDLLVVSPAKLERAGRDAGEAGEAGEEGGAGG